MQIDPIAVLALISEQASRIATLEEENQQLRAAQMTEMQEGP